MIAQLRAELLKIRSTRTTLALGIGMILLVVLFALLPGLLMSASEVAQEENQRTLIAGGHAAGLFAVLVGIMLVTAEYRHGTIRPTLLYQPKRGLLVGAKLIAGLLMGLVFGLVAQAIAVAIALVVLAGRGIDVAMSTETIVGLSLGTVVATGIWALLGVGVGAIVRHQVGAIVGVLAYSFVVESIVFGLVPGAGRFLPGTALQALQDRTTDHLLGWGAGGALALGYAAALALVGIVLTRIRDVE